MKTIILGAPKVNGQELIEEQLAGLLDEREVIVFVWKNGDQSIEFGAVVNPVHIETCHVLAYQDAVTKLTLEADELELEELALQAAEEPAEGDDAAPASNTSRAAEIVARTNELNLEMSRANAELLFRAVENTNIPGMEKPTAEDLVRRTGPGPALLGALYGWFFPTLRKPVAETGTTQAPNSVSTLDSSQQTGEEENTPPTS